MGRFLVFLWMGAVALIVVAAVPARAQHTVTIDENNNGSVRLRVGDLLKVRLRADAGTNYLWRVAENDSSLLLPQNDAQTQNGVATRTFRAIGAGGARLSLLYQDVSKSGVRALDAFRKLVIIERNGGAGGKIVAIRAEDNGRPVTLAYGDTLDVRLPTNAGTGYSWGVADNNGFLLQPSGSSIIRPSSGRMGERQGQSLRFRTVGLGNGTLSLALRRPGTGQSAETFSVPILIVPGAGLPPISGNTITLNDNDNRNNVTLNRGETVIVRLSSNPTTGYDWNLADNAPSNLQLVGPSTFERPHNNLPGAGGVRVYRFKVISSGGGALRFLYQRSWEKSLQAARKWEIFFDIPR